MTELSKKQHEDLRTLPFLGFTPDVWYCVDTHDWGEGHGYVCAKTVPWGSSGEGANFRFVIARADNEMNAYALVPQEATALRMGMEVAPEREAAICNELLQTTWWKDILVLKKELIDLYNKRKEEALAKV